MAKIKELWNLLPLRQKLLSLTVVICFAVYGIIAAGSNRMVAGLSDQQAARRWDKEGEAAQVSCFFTRGTAVDEFLIKNFEQQLETALKEAAVTQENDGGRLYVSAYSAEGEITVVSEQASLDAKAVGIGGDFFLFHPLTLLDGGYFSGNDLMKDSVLLDEDAAWRLFGSNDIEGMSVMIGGVPHYVAGVFQKESGRLAKAAGLDETIVYVSCESLSAYGSSSGISTYELVAPNPVKGFVYNTIKEKFGLAEEKIIVVENSARYSVEAMIPVILDFGVRSMQNAAVSYPYWENIARGYEDIRALLLVVQTIFLLIPSVIVLVFLYVKGRTGMKRLGQFLKNKISFYSIIALLTVTLTGCGGASEEAKNKVSKDYVYKVEELSFDAEEYQTFSLLKSKERIYVYSYNYGDIEEPTPWIDFWSVNEDGTVKEKNKLVMSNESSLNALCPDGNGNVYAIKNVYAMEPDENGEYKESYYLNKMTEQGEELFSVELNTIPELVQATADSYFYAGHVIVIENDIYVNIVDRYAKFDSEGNFVKLLEAAEGESFESAALYPLENGKVAAITYEDNGVYASYVDLESGEFTQKTKLPGTSYEYSIYVGMGYDLYLVNSYGVYGYNVGAEDKIQLMNYIDSDLGVYSVYNVIPVSETEFLATYDEVGSYNMVLGKFSKVPPEEVKDKIGLTLACAGMDWEVRNAVVNFNKNNEEYRISIEDYSSLYGDENDYMAGINRLNADIVSGKIPDILLINSSMPVDSYIAKGLFEDIKPYIEADAELDIDDYMPNIIEAYSVDGKMYQIVPSYMVHTLVAKASDVGVERGWTVQDAEALLASKPEGTELFTYMTRDQILRSCIVADGQFIDWKTGQCSFDSESFIQLLNFSMNFPESIDDTVYAEDYWMNYESQWREGKVICQPATISNFRNYNFMMKGTFGEPITMIGYPAGEGEGTAIMANIQLAMSSKSDDKDGAYSFLRYFLSDEYQLNVNYGLPLSIKQLDAMAEEAMKMPTYTDENGNEIESPDVFYLNDMEIVIDPMTQEEVDALKADLYSITNVYTYDENLMQIIDEEAAAFFSGQKNAKDVASIIQSRVRIYVNENR